VKSSKAAHAKLNTAPVLADDYQDQRYRDQYRQHRFNQDRQHYFDRRKWQLRNNYFGRRDSGAVFFAS
jgi:hypothetical protein